MSVTVEGHVWEGTVQPDESECDHCGRPRSNHKHPGEPEPREHHVRAVTCASHRAWCDDCGFVGPWRHTVGEAQEDGRAHHATAT